MKKFMTFIMILIIMIPSYAFADVNAEARDLDEVIGELYTQRSQATLEQDFERVNEIDEQLNELGVERLEWEDLVEEVPSIVPKTKAPGIPINNDASWDKYSITYNYKNKQYTITTIVAIPNSRSSTGLKGTFSKNTANNSGKLSSQLFQLAISTSLGTVNPLASTVYDLVSIFVDNVSKTTVYSSDLTTYSGGYTSTHYFKYVREKGTNEREDVLSYSSSTVSVSYTVSMTGFVYGPNSTSVKNISKQYSKDYSPSGYNSSTNAVRSYLNETSQSRNVVNHIYIKRSGKNIVSISIANPFSPVGIH